MNARVLAQTKPSSTSAPPMHNNLLQRKVAQPSTLKHQHSEVPPIVHEVLRSPGAPLDASTRDLMEARFGHDFGHVRVHIDAKAADSASAVSALACTVGHNVADAKPVDAAARSLSYGEASSAVCPRDGRCPRCANGFAASDVPDSVVSITRTPGEPLDPRVRARLEGLFRADLSSVRLHTDNSAVATARAQGAGGYAIGRHIVLDETGDQSGGDVVNLYRLAHEVAHVIQQRRIGNLPQRLDAESSTAVQSAEAEADDAATAVLLGAPVPSPLARPARAIQFQLATLIPRPIPLGYEQVISRIQGGISISERTWSYLQHVYNWWSESGQVGSTPPHGYYDRSLRLKVFWPASGPPPPRLPPAPADLNHLGRAMHFVQTEMMIRGPTGRQSYFSREVGAIDSARTTDLGEAIETIQPRPPSLPRTGGAPPPGGRPPGGPPPPAVDPIAATQSQAIGIAATEQVPAARPSSGMSGSGGGRPRTRGSGSAPLRAPRSPGLREARWVGGIARFIQIAGPAWDIYSLVSQAAEVEATARAIGQQRAQQFSELEQHLNESDELRNTALGTPEEGSEDVRDVIGRALLAARSSLNPSHWDLSRFPRPGLLMLVGMSIWSRVQTGDADSFLRAATQPLSALNLPREIWSEVAQVMTQAINSRGGTSVSVVITPQMLTSHSALDLVGLMVSYHVISISSPATPPSGSRP